MDDQPLDGSREPPRQRRPSPPVRRLPMHLALVWLGGTAGTAARYGVGLAVPHRYGLPAATLLVNLLGAMALGVLLEALARSADTGRPRVLRLLLGTGFLGGFTTYSALAVETVALAGDGRVAAAVLYAGGTVVLGALAALIGISLGARLRRGEVAC